MTTITPIFRPVGTHGRCYESHPPIDVGGHMVYGGSCIQPLITNADIYLGFDYGMSHHKQQWPWEPGESVLFPIQDMGVPSSLASFKKMLEWTSLQLSANKLIHMGCIGGHGRTGMVLAALVTIMTGERDSVSYVRKSYCKKAVESTAQMEYLFTHFGITKVEPAKMPTLQREGKDFWKFPTAKDPHPFPKSTFVNMGGDCAVIPAKRDTTCIWGSGVKFDKPKKPAIIKPTTHIEGV
jgi:hypothetical protein